MQTAAQIRTAAMARRTAQGLKLVLRAPDGEHTTLYPKDAATLQTWLVAATRQGYTRVDDGTPWQPEVA